MQGARIRTPRESSQRFKVRGVSSGSHGWLRILPYVVVALLVWVIASPFGLYRLHRLNQERHDLLEERQKISIRLKSLRKEIETLKTDRTLQERLVKSELGWIRSNEILYIFHGE